MPANVNGDIEGEHGRERFVDFGVRSLVRSTKCSYRGITSTSDAREP